MNIYKSIFIFIFSDILYTIFIKELYENPFNALLFNSPKNVISRSSYNPIIK